MSEADDSGVRVRMRPAPAADDAADEWDEASEGGDATAIDTGALSEIRGEAPDFEAAAQEFAAAAATVMDDTQRSPEALLDAVEGGAGEASEFDDDSVTRMDPRGMANAEALDDAVGKEACPKCGVMVAPGYPNCPRCKSSLVEKKSQPSGAGGTSLGGRTVPWTIVFIAAVLTAVIYYLAERDPKIPANEESEPGANVQGELPATEGAAAPDYEDEAAPETGETDGEYEKEAAGTEDTPSDED